MSPRCERLGGGLTAIYAPCEAESVAVGVFVASGSRHEPERFAGISHLIEHMLFKGTPNRTPLEITQAIEGRGGNFNACTGEEATCYFVHLPREHLDEAVDILADMYLRASIPAAEFEREKQVVIEEIRMYADEPDAVAAENLQRAIFPKSRLGAPVAGSAASLAPLRPVDLKRYIRAHYRADNTVVVIVGDFDPAHATRLLNAAFRPLAARAGAVPAKPDPEDLEARPVPESRVEKDVNQCQLAVGYRAFGIRDRRTYAASVMDAVLGRGMSSRLFQEVREKRGLSYDIASRMHFFREAGLFEVSAGLDRAKADRALKTIDRELARIRDRRVPAAELRRTREFLTGNFRLAHEKVTSKLFFYGQTYLAFNRLVTPREQVDGIAAVTADDVRAAAHAILNDTNRSVSWVIPKAR